MRLKRLELSGFKSFAKPIKLEFSVPISAIVGPNGSGKSNVAEAMRWVLGEQSMKSLRGKKGEDLIFNGSQTAPRLGKASVSLIFDNRKKILPIDYDEVSITRKIFRDGINDYYINNSQVRLKDIVELLSRVGLGTSSHHIISQGEADRILNASMVERRQMIEDALGLKIYQLKKSEAERKLERTKENMNQVEALRKEIQPHLKFLKKQVVKAEEFSGLRENLKNFYIEYFSNESHYLKKEEDKIKKDKNETEKEFLKIKKEFSDKPEDSRSVKLKNDIFEQKKEISDKEKNINDLRISRNSVERELGRLEGMIEAVEIREKEVGNETVPVKDVKNFIKNIDEQIEIALNDSGKTKDLLVKIRNIIREFVSTLKTGVVISSSEIINLKKKQKETNDLLDKIEKQESDLLKSYEELKKYINNKEQEMHALEKERFEMEVRLKELSGITDNYKIKEENIKNLKDELYKEEREARILTGYFDEKSNFPIDENLWPGERIRIRRETERLKIKIEDSGGVGDDTIKEYEEVRKRDEFFEKELIDLDQAIKSLKGLLEELEEKINHDFRVGLEKINKEFQNFFFAMFGGGKAELIKVAPKKKLRQDEETGVEELKIEDLEREEGVDVCVNLPKKRIHSLDMLSGGERALTSIALLFAMSQVNPPPFLILDETDAALDEANSKKYGQMLVDLSKHTQLVLITHNRETMKQAEILYGVTMGSDSISKLLSIKFTEAEQYTS
ncbi:MAG: AAA family ATPase [Patescibacteria group bacterium]